MRRVSSLGLAWPFIAACGRATPAPSSMPELPVAPAMTAPAVALDSAPPNWHLLDQATDHIPGISAARAMNELLAGKAPKQTVLVAIIDGGMDTMHVDLRPALWTNPGEIARNGKDDDGNGYVDDVHGWNFIGGRDGRSADPDTYEVTREYARCHRGAAAEGQTAIADAARCQVIDSAYEFQRKQIEDNVAALRDLRDTFQIIIPALARAVGTDSLTLEKVRALNPPTPAVARRQQLYVALVSGGLTPLSIERQLAAHAERPIPQDLDPDFNPRSIVGDHAGDLNERGYGNNDVMGRGADHGTHVAGIIGGARHSGSEVHGIVPGVRLMMIRAIPTFGGDERDKDIANAIRYAVDNGARIINMSLGKDFSPYKSVVDDAVKYADAHGVLIVHCAGNDESDRSRRAYYPTRTYERGGEAQNWIEVGASSWRGGQRLVAFFSNYGARQVDVFAPGVDVLSTVPGNGYARKSGTSMAAPLVAGLAALIMEYYPSLSTAQVKRIILATATRYSDQRVLRPGSKELVPFGTLSVTGGIVNAYNAIKMAEEMSGRVRRH